MIFVVLPVQWVWLKWLTSVYGRSSQIKQCSYKTLHNKDKQKLKATQGKVAELNPPTINYIYI